MMKNHIMKTIYVENNTFGINCKSTYYDSFFDHKYKLKYMDIKNIYSIFAHYYFLKCNIHFYIRRY